MFFHNKNLDEALGFIKSTPFDLFCFQEVPAEFLPRLQKLPYHVAYVEELILSTKSRTFPIYSVILSKYEIRNKGVIKFPMCKEPLRSKFTHYLLSVLQKGEYYSDKKDRSALFVDITMHGKSVRVFNLHISLSYSRQRMKELTVAMKNKKDISIVCGDFNVLETFYISLLNFLLGGSLFEWFFYKRERRNMENYFESLNLVNPLKNKITHPLSRSQLDHILIPKICEATNFSVIKARYGSDHYPVRGEIEL